ncbi:MAG: hypothetical protein JG765_440 [Cereibacter sp.]|jgi:selenocysteine lyase/cysteine desulfurase|nr:hypothetical protein [Cereibacter sp.]
MRWWQRQGHHYRSEIEHRAYGGACEIGVTVWPINRETLMLDLADLEPLMTDRTRLVAVTHVSTSSVR